DLGQLSVDPMLEQGVLELTRRLLERALVDLAAGATVEQGERRERVVTVRQIEGHFDRLWLHRLLDWGRLRRLLLGPLRGTGVGWFLMLAPRCRFDDLDRPGDMGAPISDISHDDL